MCLHFMMMFLPLNFLSIRPKNHSVSLSILHTCEYSFWWRWNSMFQLKWVVFCTKTSVSQPASIYIALLSTCIVFPFLRCSLLLNNENDDAMAMAVSGSTLLSTTLLWWYWVYVCAFFDWLMGFRLPYKKKNVLL